MVQELTAGATVEVQGDNQTYALALYFDIIEEHTISLQSQITDNWMENNTAIADHIANQPLTVSLRGISGELVYVPSTSEGWLNDIKNKIPLNITEKLSPIASFYAPVSNVTQIAKNAISYVEASYKRYKKISDDFRNKTVKQQRLRKIYQDLSGIREAKMALLVQTPYATFDNMYIQFLVLRQGNQSNITDIELTLKQAYFTETQYTTANEENREKCNFIQRQEVENHGLTQGVNPDDLGNGMDNGNSYNQLFKVRITND